MPADYLPRADDKFLLWLRLFAAGAAATGNPQLGEEWAEQAQVVLQQFTQALREHDQAQRTARAARAAKDQSRRQSEAKVREIVGWVVAQGLLSDAELVSLGLSLRRRPTHYPRTLPAELERTWPMLRVRQGGALCHLLSYTDATSGRKGRPARSRGCMIYRAVVPQGSPPPQKKSQWEQYRILTRQPLLIRYEDVDAGKVAWYRGAWISTRGMEAHCGPAVFAMVAG